MELPPPIYDGLSRLSASERRELAALWMTRALVVAAEVHHEGALLRALARQPDREAAYAELYRAFLGANYAGSDAERRLVDRLFAILGAWRRQQYARVGELLLEVAAVADEARAAPHADELVAAGSASPVAVSVRVEGGRAHEAILEQMLGNVQARLSR